MGEIGTGFGSSYPGSLDTNNDLEYGTPSANRTRATAKVPNDLASCIIALETTLGVNPQGIATSVSTFINLEHTSTGAHNDAFVVNVSGTQTITGQKTFTGGVVLGASGFWGTASWYTTNAAVATSTGGIFAYDHVRSSGIISAAGGISQAGGGENLRMLRGTINGANGAPTAGSGFIASRTGVGAYTITFNIDFSAVPSPTVTLFGATLGVTSTIPSIAVGSFTVATAVAAVATDESFTFMVAGPV